MPAFAKLSVFGALVLSLSFGASAETLDAAMRQALANNPDLAAGRARLDATRQLTPLARAEGLPSVSVGANASSVGTDISGAPSQDRSENWSANVSASQLLYSGGRVAATTRQAEARVAAAEADYQTTEQQVLLQVTQAYAGLIEAEAVLAARNRTVSNVEETRKLAEARFNAGLATKTDLALAEARLAQARTQAIQAQGARAAVAETYRRLVGAEPTGLSPPATPQGLPQTLDAALAAALSGNPAIRSAEADRNAAAAGLAAAKAAASPRVSLEAGASRSEPWRGAGRETTQDSVGVRVTAPLYSGGAIAARTREQRALETAADRAFDAASSQVREQATTAYTDLLTARAALLSARDQLAAAEIAYRGIRLEQETGLRTTVDVLDNENDLLAAQLAVAAAERQRVVAERRLQAALGALAPAGE